MPLAAPLRPFLNWSVETDPTLWGEVDVALLGLPYSEHYSGNPRPNDQARAPEDIRLHSNVLTYAPNFHDFTHGATLEQVIPRAGRDAGNLAETGDFDAYYREAVAVMRRQFETARFSIMLGGDHGATIPAFEALEVRGPVHVVQIDAHMDWREEVRGARRGYSSTMRRASEMPWIKGMTQIGLRCAGSAREEEARAARAWGAELVTALEVHRNLQAVLDGLKGKGPFYITIDADGMDPSVMPGCLWPVPGGLRYEQLQEILLVLAREGLVGMDIVEVGPSYDLPNHLTAITAARMMVDGLAFSRGFRG